MPITNFLQFPYNFPCLLCNLSIQINCKCFFVVIVFLWLRWATQSLITSLLDLLFYCVYKPLKYVITKAYFQQLPFYFLFSFTESSVFAKLSTGIPNFLLKGRASIKVWVLELDFITQLWGKRELQPGLSAQYLVMEKYMVL